MGLLSVAGEGEDETDDSPAGEGVGLAPGVLDYQAGFSGFQQEFAELTGVVTVLILELVQLETGVELVAHGTLFVLRLHIETPGCPTIVELLHFLEGEGIMAVVLHVLRNLLEELVEELAALGGSLFVGLSLVGVVCATGFGDGLVGGLGGLENLEHCVSSLF